MGEQEACRLWKECRSQKITEVAAKNGVTVPYLIAQFKSVGLMGNGPKDPSPAEISLETKRAQEQWTPEFRESRWVGQRAGVSS